MEEEDQFIAEEDEEFEESLVENQHEELDF
jgi:hypothetical protein